MYLKGFFLVDSEIRSAVDAVDVGLAISDWSVLHITPKQGLVKEVFQVVVPWHCHINSSDVMFQHKPQSFYGVTVLKISTRKIIDPSMNML